MGFWVLCGRRNLANADNKAAGDDLTKTAAPAKAESPTSVVADAAEGKKEPEADSPLEVKVTVYALPADSGATTEEDTSKETTEEERPAPAAACEVTAEEDEAEGTEDAETHAAATDATEEAPKEEVEEIEMEAGKTTGRRPSSDGVPAGGAITPSESINPSGAQTPPIEGKPSRLQAPTPRTVSLELEPALLAQLSVRQSQSKAEPCIPGSGIPRLASQFSQIRVDLQQSHLALAPRGRSPLSTTCSTDPTPRHDTSCSEPMPPLSLEALRATPSSIPKPGPGYLSARNMDLRSSLTLPGSSSSRESRIPQLSSRYLPNEAQTPRVADVSDAEEGCAAREAPQASAPAKKSKAVVPGAKVRNKMRSSLSQELANLWRQCLAQKPSSSMIVD